jgi:hypothetical protein
MRTWLLGRRPKVLGVALAIHGAGITAESALAKIADMWRPLPMDTVKWSALRQLSVRTLETLEEANLLRARPNFVYQHVANEWPFPLYPLDLPELEVDPDHLREAQRNCYPPDGY